MGVIVLIKAAQRASRGVAEDNTGGPAIVICYEGGSAECLAQIKLYTHMHLPSQLIYLCSLILSSDCSSLLPHQGIVLWTILL